jgi:hypothetical protein
LVFEKSSNQFDDEVVATGPHYEALIDGFVIHEKIENKDIVVRYGAHFTHLPTHDSDVIGHIIGPELVPQN